MSSLDPSFKATLQWLFLRVSLTPFLSLSHWFWTTYPQLLLESVSERNHKDVLQCFGMWLIVVLNWCCLMLPDAGWCWLMLLDAAACYWCLAKCAMVAAELVDHLKVSIDFALYLNVNCRKKYTCTGFEPWTSGTLSDDFSTGPLVHAYVVRSPYGFWGQTLKKFGTARFWYP